MRSRAFGQLTLARVLVHTGRPDEAAGYGRDVCAVAPSLTSTRVRSQLAGLGAALRPNRSHTGVVAFLDQLAALPAADTGDGESLWPV